MSHNFNHRASQQRKQMGLALAEAAVPASVELCREIAREIAGRQGSVTADDVGRELARRGYPSTIGPAAGSIFKSREWRWTGQFKQSARVKNHGRLLRVWALA